MHTRSHAARSSRQRGLTLVECAVATATMAVAAGAVVPGLSTMRAQQTLVHAASAFETDVQHARSMSVATGTTWRIVFDQSGGATCYMVHTGDADDCRCTGEGRAVCASGAEVLRTAWFGGGQPIALTANVRTVAFDALKGTTTPAGTVRLQARGGGTLHQVVNIMGRVRSCTPDRSVSGYKPC